VEAASHSAQPTEATPFNFEEVKEMQLMKTRLATLRQNNEILSSEICHLGEAKKSPIVSFLHASHRWTRAGASTSSFREPTILLDRIELLLLQSMS
jgi:hypothetical protein